MRQPKFPVNNAAAGSVGPRVLTKDGLLDIMVINHFSHFVLTGTLLPLLKKTAEERNSDVQIVNLSSIVHADVQPDTFATKEAFNKTYGESPTQLLTTYGNTKLANTLHVKELQRRLDAESVPITCIALHPGAIQTDGSNAFLTSLPYVGRLLAGYVAPLFFGAPQQGAMTVAFAAAGRKVAFAQDERLQKELYDTSERLTAEFSW
ncbi:hypothetical protein K438DRAFT_1992615 [Mycena galopus ATCC 62051]|nr:hypothetical protein K438DRAFT_1992615 [Mycena galopus ATCC 62051]